MKIAYVTTYNASDVHYWSGSGYYIAQSLADANFELQYIGNLREKFSLLWKAKTFFYQKIGSKNHFRDREPYLLKSYAKQVSNALRTGKADIVFSPGTIPIAYLETDKPIVYWTDATFAGMMGFYPEFSNLCQETIENGNRMEQEALSRCNYAIFASDWAAKTAMDNYNVDAKKIKVVPFGANISCNRTISDIEEMLRKRDNQKIKLLFCGVDWHRKGGDIALKATKILFDEGYDVELNVVGCRPPGLIPDFVKVYGFVSKKTTEGRKLLDSLFSSAHFLILPSLAECYGVVFAEASSFGLPSITTNVGGIPTVVTNGINGQLFSITDHADKYCSYIKDIVSSKGKYHALTISTFKEYESRLNWTVAGRSIRNIIRGIIN